MNFFVQPSKFWIWWMLLISSCSGSHAKAFSKVSSTPRSEIMCFPLSMMEQWVWGLLCVIISGDPETIFYSLSKVCCPCLQFASLILWKTCRTTHGIWKKWDLVHIHHISYGVIYFLQHSHWHVTNSCKKYKIAFLRFMFILISQCTYWFLIFYGFCLISREDYSISLNNVVGLLSLWNFYIQIYVWTFIQFRSYLYAGWTYKLKN